MACPYGVGDFSGSGIMCELEKLLDSAATIIGLCVFAVILLMAYVAFF